MTGITRDDWGSLRMTGMTTDERELGMTMDD